MLIRSQDNTILANLVQYKYLKIRAYERKLDDKGKIIYAYDGGYGTPNFNCWKIGTSDFDLGEYSTEEKAIKVLDMIQEFYNKCFAFTMENDGCYHEVSESKVFQMPQDADVEGQHGKIN